MEKAKYKIRYIANAGVMIESDKTKIVIDGIHNKKTSCFSPVPSIILNELIEGKNQFSDINYLLFTHYHPDHMDIDKTNEFLSKNNGVVICPKHYEDAKINSFSIVENPNKIFLHSELGVCKTFNLNDIKIKYFRSIHDGEDYKTINNYCYIIYFEGNTFLHLGDAMPDYSYLKKILSKEKIDYAFLNFPYVALPKNRKIVNEIIGPKKIFVIHLPFKEDDKFNYRRATCKVLERYPEKLLDTTIFLEPMQKVEF